MKKFYLGMDVGTDSVGMACTDEEYRLLRAKGRDLWAVRLFDQAETAEKRRGFRTARRRLARRKQRIDTLQAILAPYMEDELFFIRLNNSGFYEEDKDERLKTRFALFADEDYTDREFYKRYPTIFHLRLALIRGEDVDLRHYYLALHHILKYRGHFLFEGNVSEFHEFKRLYEVFSSAAEACFDSSFSFDDAEKLLEIVKSETSPSDKKKRAAEIFSDSSERALAYLIIGSKVNATDIFGEEYAERYKDEKLCFAELNDESFEQKRDVFVEEHFELLLQARAIYGFAVFEKLLGGKEYLSEAMVGLYEKHKNDLKLLKSVVKESCKKGAYNKIFRSGKEEKNYANYVRFTKLNGEKISVCGCKSEDFFKELENTLESERLSDTDERFDYILSEINKGSFLPKILNADNGLFPRQINEAELKRILERMTEKYPQLAQKEADGFSASEKIEKLFTFRIPYYVGPLNGSSDNAWLVRK